jgi:1-acyl-sn-glycerol-3-phosphate acyltransferase
MSSTTSPWPTERAASQRFFSPLVYGLGRALLFLLGPVRVVNRKAVVREGGLLLMANHIADVDPIVVQAACPRHIFFMSKSELFEMPSIAWFMRWWRAFPVRRGEPDRASLKHAINLLKQGNVVCIFPEGELSESGKLLPLLPGVALIARAAKVPLQCCGLVGTNKILPYGKLIPRMALGGVSATFGEAKQFEENSPPEEILAWTEAEIRRLTNQ